MPVALTHLKATGHDERSRFQLPRFNAFSALFPSSAMPLCWHALLFDETFNLARDLAGNLAK